LAFPLCTCQIQDERLLSLKPGESVLFSSLVWGRGADATHDDHVTSISLL